MTLHQQKKFLLRSETAAPTGWPDGWQFPVESTWPPGWPKPLTEKVWLDGMFVSTGVLVVLVLDQHDEDTDVLDGQFLRVKATDGTGNAVRMRQSEGAPWSEEGLFQINKCKVTEKLEFEVPHPSLQIMLYGFENPGRGTLVQA